MKKALEFSMVMLLILLAGVFLVTSCSNPSDGRDGLTIPGGTGANGADGGFYVTAAAITAPELALLFERAGAGTVVLAYNTPVTIDGVVPAGKSLRVAANGNVTVLAGAELVVNGTLIIEEEAALIADGTVASGYLVAGGSITGPGFVFLPVILDDSTIDLDLDGDGEYDSVAVDYTSDIGAVTVASSTYDTGVATAITAPLVTDIFNETTITEVRVYNLTGIGSGTIPNGTGLIPPLLTTSRLVLLGSGNELSAAAVFEPVGEVVVRGTLATTSAVNIEPIGNGKVTVEEDGILNLAIAADKITSGASGKGIVENNGTIRTITTTLPDFRALLVLTGSGTISSGASVDLSSVTTTVPLSQNLLINAGTITVPAPSAGTDPLFNGGKTITVANAGTLAFAGTDIRSTGHPIGAVTIASDEDFPGLVTTSTGDDAILAAFLTTIPGRITASGALNALSAPLVVPEDVSLTVSAGTFATGTSAVTVNGTATFTAATFTSVTGAITVNGDATFTAAVAAAAPIVINGKATFTVSPTLATAITVNNGGDATFNAALTAAAASTLSINSGGEATVNGDLSLAATTAPTTIAGDLTVTGDLTVGTALAFTVNGKVVIDSSTTTGTGTITTGASGVIEVDGVSYKTTATGVAGTAIDAAIVLLADDLDDLTDSVNLATTFGKAPTIRVEGIGSIITTGTGAITIKNGGDGTGTDIALSAGTTFNNTPTYAAHKYSLTNLTVPISMSTTALQLTDAGWAGATVTKSIFTVSNLQLKNAEVLVTVPAFNIGLSTTRAP